MTDMQIFYERISASARTMNDRLRQLAGLTRLTRDQVVNAAAELTWFIWNAPETARQA